MQTRPNSQLPKLDGQRHVRKVQLKLRCVLAVFIDMFEQLNIQDVERNWLFIVQSQHVGVSHAGRRPVSRTRNTNRFDGSCERCALSQSNNKLPHLLACCQ